MPPAETANPEQLAAWDGAEGAYWTDHEAQFDAAVRAYNVRFFVASDIEPHHRVLDIGCGCGETTREAARLAHRGYALGIDLSRRMIERARARAQVEALTNVAFEQADAQVHAFPGHSFDAAISRFGAMFFSDPVAAFSNIRRALAPKGRLTLLVWQAFDRNEWIVAVNEALAVGRRPVPPPPGAPGPFSLAEPDTVRAILGTAGFTDVEVSGVDAPFHLGGDAREAFEFVAGLTAWMLDGLDEAQRSLAHERLLATMHAHDTGLGVVFRSSAWIVTARSD